MLLVCMGLLSVAGTAAAQLPDIAPVPKPSEPGDLDEVDDVVDDEEVLPRGKNEGRSGNVAAIERLQADELSYSNNEIRSRFGSGLAIGVGASKPWQTYTVEAFLLARPDVAYGLYAGAGSTEQNGVAFEQTYDLSVDAQVVGMSGRYYFERLSRLSVEGLLGYVAWEGRYDPHGSDDEELSVDKLSASFTAAGVAVGFDVVLDWVWENGVYLDWTLVGVRRSRVTSIDVSREAEGVSHAVTRDLERAAFYGLTNLRVGYLF